MSRLNEDLLISDLPHDEFVRQVAETPTEYQDRSCCGCRFAYFPVAKITICGHWIFRPAKPIVIGFFFLLLSAIGYYDIWAYGASIAEKVCLSIALFFLMICVVVSYLKIIIVAPGYLPFNYFYTKREAKTWEDQMSSIAVYKEQVELARESERPRRSTFSIRVRRFVLRADHYCDWAETFIGLYNMRHFLLNLLWVDIYCLYWILMHIPMCLYIHEHKQFEWLFLLTLCSLPFIVAVFGVSMFHTVVSYRDACKNYLSLERWKHNTQAVFDNGSCIANFEEICGERKYILFWPCPCCDFAPLADGFYTNY